MNIFKSFIFLFFLICSLNANPLLATKKLTASGGVTDLVINNSKLYAATTSSSVDIFDIKTKEFENKITLPKITDFMGDIIDSKIYSVDVLNNKVLILSQGKKGGRNIDIYENGKLTNIISDKKRLFIGRAKFINEDKIIFSLLSNQLFLYDLKQKKNIYSKQISQSRFSYFSLDEKKEKIVIADESGNLQLLNVSSGEVIKTFKNQNLDNVFQIDFKNDKILTAGQDRRAVFYSKNQIYYKESAFLIYSCALNRLGNLGAYSSNENNDVTVFDTSSKIDLFKLTGNKMTLSKIIFLNSNEIFIASDDKNINYYKLKD
ncbi:MAG: WD40 repeat domain-containing protein [Arcobacter sp.]|uniref:WD40 repeat domain-containing protein n=1 Tax=Arcobacter sp. TaxID=1872629 RepID=UPI003B00179D